MGIKRLMCSGTVAMFILSMAMTGQAADKTTDTATDGNKDKTQAKVENKLPIVIEADKLSFSDLTGDLSANGHVSVVQNTEKILTDFIRGNSKTTEFWIDGKADFFQPGTKLTGVGTHYNYTQHVGTMQNITGKVDKDIIVGKNIDILPDEMIVHDGTVTECTAKIPDYHVSAERAEIWPGDKMIVYNAKFWIKDVEIFSMSKYQASLKKDDRGMQEAFPRVGYNSTDGLSLREHLEYPIGDRVAAFTNIWYYSQHGFEPQVGLIERERTYSLQLVEGEYRDSNSYWVKKEPELRFDLYKQRVGKLPVSYIISAIYGKWTDAAKTSWHQDYTLYFYRDPIMLTKTLSLNLGTGVEQVRESFDGSVRNIFRFDGVLSKEWSPKLTTYVEYHYTRNNNSLFTYETPELAREGDVGFKYKLDKKNAIGLRQSYDLNTNKIFDQDYSWYKDLHCWQGTITYRAKRHQLKFELSTTRF